MNSKSALSQLPKIDNLVRDGVARGILVAVPVLTQAIRREVARMREGILQGRQVDFSWSNVQAECQQQNQSSLRSVINGTGVILHTNLGRAPLAEKAIAAVRDVAAQYSTLEFDLQTGQRGSRHDHVRKLISDVTAAEDAVVVNNNAAAVMLSLAGLASGKQVIVSRGELVEIGGGFRIPDVMALSGARLVEVGTTNKTRLSDYENAIGPDTAMLLKVHRSNFSMTGFVEEANLAELAQLARARGVPLVYDIGCGILFSEEQQKALGLPVETPVGSALASGADLVLFSGDKLLGGPQAGIVVGKSNYINMLRKHPVMRALRPDKMTLAALCATFQLFRDQTLMQIPTYRMLAETKADLRVRAEELASLLGEGLRARVALRDCDSTVGGGAMPDSKLPSVCLALRMVDPNLAQMHLLQSDPPVVGFIRDQNFCLDVRTIAADEISAVARILGTLPEALIEPLSSGDSQ